MLRTDQRDHLAAEITVVLTVKVAALVLIWWLFFSPAHRVSADATSTAGHLFGHSSTSSHQTQEKS